MERIVGSISTLVQHLEAVATDPERYRPAACPHCRCSRVWRHGSYWRKADRGSDAGCSLNPVEVLRFFCAACVRTCSRLPACIAPRRWYDWLVQQAVLLLVLSGVSVHEASRASGRDRHTVRRWRDWLQGRSGQFAFFLRSRWPQLGRLSDHEAFWRNVIETVSLQQAMAWLDREVVVP